MRKDISGKNNPLFLGHKTLLFDNVTEEEISQLTDQQRVDAFLSKYVRIFHPISEFSNFFKVFNVDITFKLIKDLYKTYVLNSGWSERKYVSCINDIFEKRLDFSSYSLDKAGVLYERGELASQRRERRNSRGRI
jgi:hypothetical protein